jgi:hypothetical protein
LKLAAPAKLFAAGRNGRADDFEIAVFAESEDETHRAQVGLPDVADPSARDFFFFRRRRAVVRRNCGVGCQPELLQSTLPREPGTGLGFAPTDNPTCPETKG